MSSLTTSLGQSAPAVQPWVAAVQQAPTLAQMIPAAWRLGLAVALLVVQEVLTARAQAPTTWPVCPQCGTRLHSKGFVPRQLLTLLGVLQWERRVGRCPKKCPIGQVAPLDTALGLAPHQETSRELQHLACAFAVFVPFATAAELVGRVVAVPVSPAAIWGWVQAAGRRAQERLDRELQRLAAGHDPALEPLDPATAQLPLVVGADGVMVPFRPEQGSPKGHVVWREVKVAIVTRLGQRLTRAGHAVPHLECRRLVAVLGDIDALAPRLWLEAVRQGVRTAPLVVWVSDGARGLWRLFATHFGGLATGILDFYHAAQHLWTAAAARWGEHTPRAREWFSIARHQLRHGDADAVFEELTAALALQDLPAGARATLRQVYDYLDKHRAHIDYEKFKELGLPLGSGMVESACKWLIQQRFKGVGMRWSEDGFNHLLHLRLAWVNGRFDALFELQASPNS